MDRVHDRVAIQDEQNVLCGPGVGEVRGTAGEVRHCEGDRST